jgi:hypothetical protein
MKMDRKHRNRLSVLCQNSLSNAVRRLRSATARVGVAILAASICVAILEPNDSLAASHLLSQMVAAKCSPPRISPEEKCHLSFDDLAELRQGRWGLGVHPVDPSYFCYQREKRLEARNQVCR